MPETKTSLNDDQPTVSSRKLAARKIINASKYHKIASKLFHAGSETSLEDVLIAASKDGDLERLISLLQRSDSVPLVDVDARDKTTGNTSLILASKRAHIKIVQFLLAHRADVTLRNYNGQTALEVASPAIKNLLLDNVGNDVSSPEKQLLQAAWQANLDAVKNILRTHDLVDVNCTNGDGLTALMLVSRDLYLFTRLSRQLKRLYSPVEVIAELLLNGADLHLCDPESKSCLHYAASSKAAFSEPVVQLMVDSGSPTDQKDRRNFTPLHCACQTGNAGVVTALVSGGSDVNVSGYGGTTPLHIAAYNDYESVAVVLLSHGADVTLANDENLIAADVAKSRKMKALLRNAMETQLQHDAVVTKSPGEVGAVPTAAGDCMKSRESLNISPSPIVPLKHRILRQPGNKERSLMDSRIIGHNSPKISENVRQLGQVRSATRTRKSLNSAVRRLPPVVIDRVLTPDQRGLKSASSSKLQNLEAYNASAATEHLKYLAALSDQIIAYDNELQENIRKLCEDQGVGQGHVRSRSDVPTFAALAASCQDVASRRQHLPSGVDDGERRGRPTSVPRRLTPLHSGVRDSPVCQPSPTTHNPTFVTQQSDTDITTLLSSQESSPRSSDDFPELIRFEEAKNLMDYYHLSPSFMKSEYNMGASRANESMILSSGSDNSVESKLTDNSSKNAEKLNNDLLNSMENCYTLQVDVTSTSPNVESVPSDVDNLKAVNNQGCTDDCQFPALTHDKSDGIDHDDNIEDQTGEKISQTFNCQKTVTFGDVEMCEINNDAESNTCNSNIIVPKILTVSTNALGAGDMRIDSTAATDNVEAPKSNVSTKRTDVKTKTSKISCNSSTPRNSQTARGSDVVKVKNLSIQPTRLITSAKKRDILNTKVGSDNSLANREKPSEKKLLSGNIQKSGNTQKNAMKNMPGGDNASRLTKIKTKSKIVESNFKSAWGTAASKLGSTIEKKPQESKERVMLLKENGSCVLKSPNLDKGAMETQNATNHVRISIPVPNKTDVELVAPQQTPVIVDPYKDMQPNIAERFGNGIRQEKTVRPALKKDNKIMATVAKRRGIDQKTSRNDRPVSNTRAKTKVKKKKSNHICTEEDLPIDKADVALISGDGWHIATTRDRSSIVDQFILQHMTVGDNGNNDGVIKECNYDTVNNNGNNDAKFEAPCPTLENTKDLDLCQSDEESKAMSSLTLENSHSQDQEKKRQNDVSGCQTFDNKFSSVNEEIKDSSQPAKAMNNDSSCKNLNEDNLNDIVEEILGSSSMNNSSTKSLVRRNSSTNSLIDGSGMLLRKLKNAKSLFHAKSRNYDEVDPAENAENLAENLKVNHGENGDTSVHNTVHGATGTDSVSSENSTLNDEKTAETNPDLLKLFYAEDYKFGKKVNAMLNAGANTNRLEAMLAVENRHIERIMHSFRRIELQTNRRGLILYDDDNKIEQTMTQPKQESASSVNRGRFQEIKQVAEADLHDDKKLSSQCKNVGSERSASSHSQDLFRSDSASSTYSSKSVADDIVQWTKGNILGRGAFGTVWCGLTSYGEMIAIKQIELNTSATEKANAEYEKIQEEVELLKTLKHKNIVGYLGTSFVESVVSIYMQFVPGGSIASVLARFGPLNESVFCRYTKQILEGVRYLHANDVIHRDIKGGNVMLMPTGIIKLIDFGCAKRLCINLSLSQSQILKSMKGTPYWMAPEIVNESGHGKKSDIWSIGCTVFEMATGKPPWSGMNPIAAIFAIGTDRPVPQLDESFSQSARDFVNASLTRDQNKRPSAVDLLRHAFMCKRKLSNKS